MDISSKIPHPDLSEGIIACLRNANRHYEDANALNKDSRTLSAITSLALAKEEFVKAVFLIDYFRKGEPVPISKYNEYFTDHKVRLEEFEKYFHNTIPNYPEWAKNFKGTGKREQKFKEKLAYVEWIDFRWHDPNYFHELAFSTEDKIKQRLSNIYKVDRWVFIDAWNHLMKDPILEKIKKYPKTEKPTKLKVIEIVNKSFKLGINRTSIRVTRSKIQINLNPNLLNVNEKKEKIKKILRERFPSWDIQIRLSDERFASNLYPGEDF